MNSSNLIPMNDTFQMNSKRKNQKNNHHATAYCLLLWLSMLVSGCFGRKEETMSSKTPMPFTVVTSLNSLPSSPLDAELIPPTDIGVGPQGYVIRNINGLTQLGFEVDTSRKDSSEAGWNSIDWSRYSLVILTLGVQGTTGHSIRFDSVEKIDDTIAFSITHLEPKGAVGEALTHPASMLQVEKLPVDFKPVLKINGKPVACDWHFLD